MSAGSDQREPTSCPRCGQTCTYDGWAHVHANGVGIGSCPAEQGAGDLAQIAAVLTEHLPRDRYRDDGEAIGTYCTCGNWQGNYFADGESGPFDLHLATVLASLLAATADSARAEQRALFIDLYARWQGPIDPDSLAWQMRDDLRRVMHATEPTKEDR